MSRLLLVIIVILVVFIGGLFVFAGMDTEKAPVRVEKLVPNEKLAK